MRKLFSLAVACTIWLLMFTGSAAANITYEVGFTINGGSVTGTITTDDFTGPLFTSDIVGFNLTLMDQNAEAMLTNPGDASIFIGSGFLVANATGTALSFNFNNTQGFVNFFSSVTGQCQPLLSVRGTAAGGTLCNSTSPTGITIAATPGPPGSVSGTPATTAQGDLGLVNGEFPLEGGAPTPTPEPASLGMVLVGLVSVIGLRKLRF